jgi:kynurenine formamidase
VIQTVLFILPPSSFKGAAMTQLIDLSYPLEHGQLNFPYDPKISVVVHNTVASIGYNITQISMSTHQGTHLDVPFHFFD